jgi:hypothetical protein
MFHKAITKILVSAAIALCAIMWGAAPADADPNSVGTDPNPFSGLNCNCHETAPPGSPARREEIERGLREGTAAWSPPAASPYDDSVRCGWYLPPDSRAARSGAPRTPQWRCIVFDAYK